MSRINSYKRGWSSSQDSTSDPQSSQGWAPPPPSASQSYAAEQSARRLKLLEAAFAAPETERMQGTKRESPIDVDALDDAPASKRRALPWEQKTAPKPAARDFLTLASEKPVAFSSGKAPAAGPVKLSAEQDHILQLVIQGKNIFFTGSAGTGKSVLLREIIDRLRKSNPAPDAVAVTASTGIAACNIGGITLHSFSGAGLCDGEVRTLAGMVKKNKKANARWLRTKVLIVDEISMVDGDLFDKMVRLARFLRGSEAPFGGIQLIVTGDFFQLPPVMKSGQPKFAFEAEEWTNVIDHTFNLTQVFRQKDPTFVTMLNEMRFGKLSQESIRRFYSLSRALQFDDGLAATELFPRREDVDKSNSTQLAELDKNRLPSYTYEATDGGQASGDQREKLLANFMAIKRLKLTKGSQVMLIKNSPDDPTLVNGSTGIVIGFLEQPPQPGAPKTSVSNTPPWPIVRFKMPGVNAGTRDVMVGPETFKVELPSREIQASRTQLPLILSWAMSIHKSQGQTLDRVKVDLRKVFEKGQAYVALSRATSLEGLQVLGFDPSKVQAHPKVIAWSKTLEAIDVA